VKECRGLVLEELKGFVRIQEGSRKFSQVIAAGMGFRRVSLGLTYEEEGKASCKYLGERGASNNGCSASRIRVVDLSCYFDWTYKLQPPICGQYSASGGWSSRVAILRTETGLGCGVIQSSGGGLRLGGWVGMYSCLAGFSEDS
jgi:hypothetical protein